MKRKMFVYTLLLAAAVLTLFGSLSAAAATAWYRSDLVQDLSGEAALLAAQLPSQIDMDALARQSTLALQSQGRDVRVTIVDTEGTVLGDSSADWHTMENHLERPEIAQALRDGASHDVRYSSTLKTNLLYVALYDRNTGYVLRLSTPMVAVQQFYRPLAAFFAGGVLLSLAVAAILAYYSSHRQARPLDALRAMTEQIAQGNYKAPAPALHEPEFAALAQGLTSLSRDLDAHVSALRDGNNQLTTVLSSITEGLVALDGQARLLFINAAAARMLGVVSCDGLIGCEANQVLHIRELMDLAAECIREGKPGSAEITISGQNPQLLQATASPMQGAPGCLLLLVDVTQLRKLEHIRRDFVANVTHELRTPLTSIRGYVETLQSGAVNSPELSAKFLQIIEIEAERLSNLIGDLLLLSEIENNAQDTGIRRFRLRDVAVSVAEMLQFSAAARNISVTCDISEDIHLDANPDRIKQLLLNLADNAVKYNVDGGSVVISAERSAGLVRIRVKDTGIGISQEHVSRIFERFYRVDKGRSRSMGGTGLGLSITKHIADLYKGNIRLISEPGHGSEFIIELPQAQRREGKRIDL